MNAIRSRRPPARVRLGFLLVCAGAPTLAARAEESAVPSLEAGAPALAETRYQNGRRLYGAGDYAGAVREFSAALDMFPTSSKLAFNLGRSYERLDEPEAAMSAYRRYLTITPQATDREEMERLIAGLERRVEAERPTVAVTSEPAGATVAVDDVSAEGATPVTLRVTPGAHILRFRLAGFDDATRPVTAKRGESVAVHVALSPVPVPAPAVSAAAPPPPTRTAGWVRPVGWGLVGVGAASAALGGYFAYSASATADDAEGLGRTPAELTRHRRLEGDFDDQVTWAVAGSAVGAALVLGGGALLLLVDDAPDAPAVGLGPSPGGLSLQGRWP